VSKYALETVLLELLRLEKYGGCCMGNNISYSMGRPCFSGFLCQNWVLPEKFFDFYNEKKGAHIGQKPF